MKILGLLFFIAIGFNGNAQDFKYLPEAEGCLVVKHKHYALCYSEQHEQALWVAYQLTDQEASGRYDRTNNFREDHKVNSESASLSDFKGTGYDRGHLVPAGDMGFSRTAMSESFYLSNISPQEPGFNRGIWRVLESQVRDWARAHDEVYVVTGGIFNRVNDRVGPNDVSVPGSYYKIVVDLSGQEKRGIAFIMPHRSLKGDISNYTSTIDQVESRMDIDFFPGLRDNLEDKIESQENYAAWGPGQRKRNVSYLDSDTGTGGKLEVNVNSASQAELEQLHGIGPVKAGRIIEGRPYYKPNDLRDVKGIGPKTLEDIRGNIEF